MCAGVWAVAFSIIQYVIFTRREHTLHIYTIYMCMWIYTSVVTVLFLHIFLVLKTIRQFVDYFLLLIIFEIRKLRQSRSCKIKRYRRQILQRQRIWVQKSWSRGKKGFNVSKLSGYTVKQMDRRQCLDVILCLLYSISRNKRETQNMFYSFSSTIW